MRLRSILYSDLKRSAIFLRHVLTLQRRRPSLRATISLLALLALLPQPSTYWIGGVLAATLNNMPVRCAPQEAAYFNPPPGSTCSSYAQDFVNAATGYLTNSDATTNCGYCQYSSGVEYMRTLNIEPKDKWGYFGIFLGFCISNWALVYFFYLYGED
jgi:ABC-type multidrug transport system permease subunit